MLPRSSVTVFCFVLMAVARRPRRSSAPIVSVPRQTVFSGSSPFHKPFDNGGRVYGGCGTAGTDSGLPLGSGPRGWRPAGVGGRPPPVIQDLWLVFFGGFL